MEHAPQSLPPPWRDPWCLGLGLLALALRLIAVNAQLWFDEVQLLVELVRQPLGHVLTSYENDNNHPLYTVLSWFSVAAFGESPWALRLPAVLFGALSVPLLYRLAARYRPRGEAVMAGLMLALGYHHVWFSQNARGYTALLFFSLLSTLAFLRVLETRRRGAMIVHGLGLAGATFAHLTGIYVAFAQFIVWGVLKAKRDARAAGPSLAGFFVGGAVSLGLHAGMIGQILHFFLFRENARAPEADWTSPLWTLVEAGRSFGLASPAGALLGGLVFLLGVVGLLWWWRRDAVATAVFVLPGLLGLGVTLALGRNLWPRFFFFVSGFAVIILLRGLSLSAEAIITRLGRPDLRRLAALGAMNILLLASCVILPRAWQLPKQDFEGARDWVRERRQEGDAVMTVGLACYPYLHYYAPDFEVVTEASRLTGARQSGKEAFVLTTFPVFLRTRFPELFTVLDRDYEEVARFRGSAGDGDVIVLTPRRD